MNRKLLAITLFTASLYVTSCTEDDDYTYGVWERRSDFDGVARSDTAGFMIDGNGYICCGYDGKYRLNDLWKYNIDGDYWTQRASLPESAKCNSGVGFSINGKGYITTGYDGSNYLAATWEYDPTINEWKSKDDFPKARYKALAFAIGNYGYVGTGYDGNYQKDFYRFDPSAPSGSQWSIMNGYGGQKRMSGSAFVVDEKAYIFCGINNGSYPDDLYCYDPSTDTWTKKRDISDSSDDDYDDDYTSITRSGAVCMVIDGKMYLATGESGSLLSTYWVYDPETDLWNNDDFTLFEGSARTAVIGFSNGKRGFIVTGRSSSYYFDDNWELLPYEIEED